MDSKTAINEGPTLIYRFKEKFDRLNNEEKRALKEKIRRILSWKSDRMIYEYLSATDKPPVSNPILRRTHERVISKALAIREEDIFHSER